MQKTDHQQARSDYANQVFRLFVEIRKCRMGRLDNYQVVVAKIKDLDRTRNQTFPPLMQYVLSNLQMQLMVLADIRYAIACDRSLLHDINDFLPTLSNYVFKQGNLVCYNFLRSDCEFFVDPIDELSLATLYNNYELVNYFVTQKSYDVNAVQVGGEAPLVTAVDKNYSRVARLLLANGADISVKKDNKSLFRLAIQNDHLLMLSELVEFQNSTGINITSIVDEDGYTLLHKAIDSKRKQIVDYLLNVFGKDLKDPNGFDLVNYACTENNYEMAEHLVKTYPDSFSYTAMSLGEDTILHLCSYGLGTFAAAKSLIDAKHVDIAKQNKVGDTFLHVAVSNSNVVLANYYLYLFRANKIQSIVNIENKDGKTVGHLLLDTGQIELLIEYLSATDLNLLKKDKHGNTLLEKIVASGNNHLIFESLLLIQNTNKAKRKLARGILFKSEILMQSIDFLMFAGVTDSHKVPEHEQRITEWVYAEQTPLHIICETLSFVDIQVMIAKYKFDVNSKNSKRCSVVQHMLINSRFSEAKQFIEVYQPNLLDLDNMGSSLLHLACELQNIDLVEYSLSKGFLPLIFRNNSVSPLDIAIKLENQQIVSILWAKLSITEQFTYFNQANEQEKKFLQTNKIYQISLDKLFAELNAAALEFLLPEIIKPLAAIEVQLHDEYLKAEADKLCEEALKEVSVDLESSLLLEVVQDIAKEQFEMEERAATQLKHQAVMSDLEARLDIKEKYNDENLLKAVMQRDYNYFRDLPLDNSEILEVVSKCAVSLMLNAIAVRDQQLCIFLLSIPVIEAQAHTQDNVVYNTARDYGQNDVVYRLSNIAAVQKERIPKTCAIQQIQGLVPKCIFNPNYRLVIQELSKLLNTDKYKDLELYVCGSGGIKYSPQDLDLISPGSEGTFTKHLVFDLLGDLVICGAKVARDAGDNKFGYLSPKIKPDRRVIQVEWWNCKLEIILTKQTLAQHAYNSYAKVTALYFCLRQSKMFEIDGVGSLEDLHSQTIDTIVEPMLSFTVDFNRIFKLVVLSVTSQVNFHLVYGSIPSFNYDLSHRVIKAIVELFSTDNNPFLSYNVMLAKLRPKLAAIFAYDNPVPIVRALYDLKILPHLLDYLHMQKGEHARSYRESLIDICNSMDKQTPSVIQQQIMQIYNVQPIVVQDNYDPRVFQMAPPPPSGGQVVTEQTDSSIFLPSSYY